MTLDSDTEQIIRWWMDEQRVSFKQALNDLVRAGRVSAGESKPLSATTRSTGLPEANLDKAIQITVELEDDELTCRSNRSSNDTLRQG